MGSQDKLEKVLREIRITMSKGKTYGKDGDCVVVNKNKMYSLLEEFNLVMEDIKEEYELTQQSREQAERDARHSAEYIIKNANVKAEDVYAASVLYTDDALNRVQDIIHQMDDAMEETMAQYHEKLKRHLEIVRDNQSELKSQLRDMTDTKKYLNLIEDINRQREREKEQLENNENLDKHRVIQNEGSIYAKPEIKVNRAYFEQNGIPLDDEEEEKTEVKEPVIAPEISVDLDSEYFKWKNGELEDRSQEKTKKSKFFSFGKK